VGGMTRMPAVVDRVRRIFAKEPNKGVNPMRWWPWRRHPGCCFEGDVKDVLLLDVTPFPGHRNLGRIMTKLIEKNTTIPTRKSQIFSTATDSQPAVSIHVLQASARWLPTTRPWAL